jgi:hypothetical protein
LKIFKNLATTVNSMPKRRDSMRELFGTHQDSEKLWKQQHKEHISNYNRQYYLQYRDIILQKRRERRALERQRRRTALF